MKVAVIGAGVSGLVAARDLIRQGHDVTVFEAGGRCGGHAESIALETEEHRFQVELGFSVFHEAACPRLMALLADLGAETKEISVGYEVAPAGSQLVLRGSSLRDMLAIPSNFQSPAFYRLIPDWIRFARHARRILRHPELEKSSITLGEFLRVGRYSRAFAEQFAYPLVGAVNPLPYDALEHSPLVQLLGFIHNHGLLRRNDKLSCLTLREGTTPYVQRLVEPLGDRIQLNCPVASVARNDDCVLLKFPNLPRERFDYAVMALHADRTLQLLADHTREERQALEKFKYAKQTVYVHRTTAASWSDDSIIWRFCPNSERRGGIGLSCRAAHLQDHDVPNDVLVTMVSGEHDAPKNPLATAEFRRPVFTSSSIEAQRCRDHLNGLRRTFFCGAYWGRGFHEDAVRSGQEAAKSLSRKAELSLAAHC